ncbi:solute carrier family 12 member 5-like [Phasianus colchicus]|nr:solute carrier family 12 member 5-like [Phasianus colchicus]
MGACAVLTALSLSAVASNDVVPGGGPLAVLWGALGPEAGAAVGLCAFLGAAFTAAAAALGAAELLTLYVLPPAAILPLSLLNLGRSYGSALLALLGFGAAAPHGTRLAPLGPIGMGLVLLALQVGAMRAALPGAWHGLCLPLPNSPPAPLQPCPPRNSNSSSRDPETPRPAVPGPNTHLLARNLWPPEPSWDTGEGSASFGLLLGLSLPTACGVLWGCSHAAELRDAAHSVPAGSIGAAVGCAVGYLSSALLLGASVEGQLLRDKFGSSLSSRPVLSSLSWPHWLPLLGAGLAALGAGLTALLGAARLLRGLARSRALPLPHAVSSADRWALLPALLLAELGVLLGSLDLLAPVLSVFILTGYLCLNLSCAVQGMLPSPGWSPRCRLYHWALSLAGSLLCLALLFLTCWFYALPALCMAAMLYKYVEYCGAASEWGEGLRGLQLSAARIALLSLEEGPEPTNSWRPQLLVLLKLDSELRVSQPQLLALAAQLKAGRGLLVAAAVLQGNAGTGQGEARAAEQSLRSALASLGARGFVHVSVAPREREALAVLVQGCRLGALRPNCVLLGWPRGAALREDPAAATEFVELLRAAGSNGRGLLVAKGLIMGPSIGPSLGSGPSGPPLDVWWVVGDGRLLTLLPLLLRQHPSWRGCPVRLFTVALLEDNSVALRRLLESFARRLRLPASTEVVELHDSAVSAYTYERTLMMEQRSQMLRQMRLSARQGSSAPSQASQSGGEEEEVGGSGAKVMGPCPANVRRMHAAERLNDAIVRRSAASRLVLLDLPAPPPPPRPRDDNYVEFLEVLTEGLGPVLLVRGGDRTSKDQ